MAVKLYFFLALFSSDEGYGAFMTTTTTIPWPTLKQGVVGD